MDVDICYVFFVVLRRSTAFAVIDVVLEVEVSCKGFVIKLMAYRAPLFH